MLNSIQITQNSSVYEIRFKYDADLIDLVKQVPGRCWVPQSKAWTIPLDKLGFLLNQLRGTAYEDSIQINSDENIGKNEELEKSTPIPDYDISNLKMFGDPYKHQKDFMKWALFRQNVQHNMHGFLLCDTPGLGKTLESTLLAVYNRLVYKFHRCLIICCVNAAKYHWFDDIQKHSKNKYVPYILGTRINKRTGTYRADTGTAEKLEDLSTLKILGQPDGTDLPYFIILNIEAIRAKQGKQYPIADKIIELINKDEISMIVIDEIHKNTSPQSLQGKQLLRIKKATGSKVMWLPLTGTPIVSKPTDCFLPLKLVDGHSITSYWKWSQEFCIYGGFGGHEIVGYKNIPRLKSMLERNMIRRMKEDVLDLPPKIEMTEYVENTAYQNRLYKQIVSEMYEQRQDIIQSLNPLSQFLRLRQVNEAPELVDDTLDYQSKDYLHKNAKLQRLLELVEEIHERHEKVVIFDNWVQPIKMLYHILSKKYKVCVYTGTMKDEVREKNKHVFMTNPDYTIILGTIGALGTMHTLTAAQNVIFYSEPWTPADKSQASDRVYRIGTTASVNIYTLIVKDTVDEKVHNILYRKEGISNYIVDNIDIHSNPELFDLLLSDAKPCFK